VFELTEENPPPRRINGRMLMMCSSIPHTQTEGMSILSVSIILPVALMKCISKCHNYCKSDHENISLHTSVLVFAFVWQYVIAPCAWVSFCREIDLFPLFHSVRFPPNLTAFRVTQLSWYFCVTTACYVSLSVKCHSLHGHTLVMMEEGYFTQRAFLISLLDLLIFCVISRSLKGQYQGKDSYVSKTVQVLHHIYYLTKYINLFSSSEEKYPSYQTCLSSTVKYNFGGHIFSLTSFKLQRLRLHLKELWM
jgi:hypothetical protein